MKKTFTLILSALVSFFAASSMPHTLSPSTSEFAQIRANLYIVSPDKATVLMDGTLTQYDADYSNDVDRKDARKMYNSSENFGLVRGSTVLIIERRRTIAVTDTILFKMWNMRIITYQLELVTSNLNQWGRAGILEDNYLHTSTPIDLNGTSNIKFSVNADAASSAPDRFKIVFSTARFAALPLIFTSVKAFQQSNLIGIDWKTANESNVAEFNIEKSADGNFFQKASAVKANNLPVNNYHWEDSDPAAGYNYYRIGSRDADGKIKYSEIMKVYISKGTQGINKSISIYPNPPIGNNLNLQITNQVAGQYEVRLLNSFGQTFMAKSIQYTGGTSVESIKPAQNVPKGIYQLEIKTPAGEKKVISVVF